MASHEIDTKVPWKSTINSLTIEKMKLSSFVSLLLVCAATVARAQSFAYVANRGNSSVSVINTANPTAVLTLNVGAAPYGVAVSPDGTRVYVTNTSASGPFSPGFVSIINTATNSVVSTVEVGDNPTAVAVTPDGTRAYVVNNVSWSVSAIDTVSNSVIATIGVGRDPSGVAIAPNGARAYVTNPNSNSVSVIDIPSNSVIATVSTPIAYGVAVSPDGSRVYVTNLSNPGGITVINTATNSIVATVGLGADSTAVAITPDGGRAYVPQYVSSSVAVIDTVSNTKVATVAVGAFPYAIAITPDGNRAYVTNSESSSVSVIDTASNAVVATVGVGHTPFGVGITPSLSIDTTPPVISPIVTGTQGINGWYSSAVTVAWSITDPQSGIASSTGCGTTNLTSDTAGTSVTCSATNGWSLTNSVSITIKIDSVPPSIAGLPGAGCSLSPPNHQLIQVGTVTVSSRLSGVASFDVTGQSNEPENGLGDGDQAPDVVIAGSSVGPRTVTLRAERSGSGDGRIYTITATATNEAGVTRTATASCMAPK